MANQFWECEIKRNDKNQTEYNDDCVVTIVELGQIKNYPSRNFQNVTVLGQNGVTVSGLSVSYSKSETPLGPDKLNTPIPCRIKVDEDNGQYAINGRKYTIMLAQKGSCVSNKAFSSSGGSQGSNKKETLSKDEWDAIARGKVRTHLVGAAISSGQIKITSPDQIDFYVDYCMGVNCPI